MNRDCTPSPPPSHRLALFYPPPEWTCLHISAVPFTTSSCQNTNEQWSNMPNGTEPLYKCSTDHSHRPRILHSCVIYTLRQDKKAPLEHFYDYSDLDICPVLGCTSKSPIRLADHIRGLPLESSGTLRLTAKINRSVTKTPSSELLSHHLNRQLDFRLVVKSALGLDFTQQYM